MTIKLITIGKTDDAELQSLIARYQKRLRFYADLQWTVIPDLKNTKNLSTDQQKEKEGTLLMKHFSSADFVVLLDENGQQMDSVAFAGYLQKQMNSGVKNLVFVVGGPYGFSPSVYKVSNGKLSLSKMTFSHQMVRLFFVEQLYRACTILRNEPYHHQ